MNSRFHCQRLIKRSIASIKGLDGVGKDLKTVGEGLVGVGEKISEESKDVSSVKEGVSKVEKEVQESVEVPKENFKKLNERQTRSVNEIFTRYEQNKVTLDLTYTYKVRNFQSIQERQVFGRYYSDG